ncbi:MAG: helix-turn-helix transcriptional regulator [Fusobacteriaceae bacterium]|nr:helix-turn-helix transcriptional regulator [Fusobacteriaceae bacterium]MBN2838362.1 helix-turn-helix transcriptional regulator [Fusobacteriaceae bacterium]
MTETDYKTIVKQNNLINLPAKEVLIYRSKFAISSESYIMHLVQCLVKYTSKDSLPHTALHLHYNTNECDIVNEFNTYKPYSSLVQERYKIEYEFMENIKCGKRLEALRNWRELHKSVDYLKHTIGYTMENARISAAVTRTIIRIAGMQTGLPAELSDWLTSQSAKIIRHSKNIEEINKEHERLIQAYCNTIHSFKNKKYSSLVLSCIYHIEHMYQNEIIISSLADELDVTVNHLISQFRKETGITPGQYLRKERMQHATWLLSSSKLSIQDISSKIGIHDANYFTKQFRREYGETPSEYRRKRKSL